MDQGEIASALNAYWSVVWKPNNGDSDVAKKYILKINNTSTINLADSSDFWLTIKIVFLSDSPLSILPPFYPA